VLTMASIEKNKIQLKPESFSLNGFIETVIGQFRQTEIGIHASIDFKTDPDDTIIVADKFHFAQVILNILENAAKFCIDTPELKIETNKTRKGIFILFSDNGIGIPKHARGKIFQKFYRVPTGNIHNVKGFGLGLDYVKKIIKTHRWKIKVENNPEGGSIFSIFIPRNNYGKQHL
jgi:two-component system phosphate regulon sensor histidine kinase PhoR